MNKRSRKIAKLVAKLEKDGVEVVDQPTNSLFVSNSSVLVGVQPDMLEALFQPFDPNCSIFVYPNSKSYSFVRLADVHQASAARAALDGTAPATFPPGNAPLTVLFVKQVPKPPKQDEFSKALPDGLKILPNFISEHEETELEQFVQQYIVENQVEELKNRSVFHFGHIFDYSINGVAEKAAPIPPILDALAKRVASNVVPNQITVNIYEPSQGIPLHMDTHSAFEEPIWSLSLLSDVVMELRCCAKQFNVLLPRCSLLQMEGSARYQYKHGILTRKYDVDPASGHLMRRQRRISVTFRVVRNSPCQCVYPEFCDWDRELMRVPNSEAEGRRLEHKYVAEIYEQIASDFDRTRFSGWRLVNEFLDSLPDWSVVLDAGCGNGKYLLRNDRLIKLGCDIAENLLRIIDQKQRGAAIFRADALQLPVRSGAFDAAISIAVIHHFCMPERRTRAVAELLRVVRPCGRVCITAWAVEQSDPEMTASDGNHGTDVPSSTYASKMRANKMDLDTQNGQNSSSRRLRVHDSKLFGQQELLIPWSSELIEGSPHQQKGDFFRYYHLFVRGELGKLVTGSELAELCELESERYHEGNWMVVLRKKDKL